MDESSIELNLCSFYYLIKVNSQVTCQSMKELTGRWYLPTSVTETVTYEKESLLASDKMNIFYGMEQHKCLLCLHMLIM